MTATIAPVPFWKRLSDVLLCSLGLVALAPVFLLAAALVRLSSPGPVFYRARRAGYRGAPFDVLKFRTMHLGADAQGAITGKNDPRVFAAGRLLRLFKIDELPQLWNVIRGEMSVVGPRPEDVEIVEECYTAEQRRVLELAPGLTGLPQVRFFPEFPQPDASEVDPERYYREVILPMRLRLDLEYAETRTFWMDARLILATIWLIAVKSWVARLGRPVTAKAPADSELPA